MELRLVNSYKNQKCNECGVVIFDVSKLYVYLKFQYNQTSSVRLCPRCFLMLEDLLKNSENYAEIKAICVENIKNAEA